MNAYVKKIQRQFLQLNIRQKLALGLLTILMAMSPLLLKPLTQGLVAIDLALQGGANRRVPDVQAPHTGLKLSKNPDDGEFLYIGLFTQPLTPVSKTSDRENRALADAIRAYNAQVEMGNRDAVAPLRSFLDAHPNSAWKPSLLLNIGMVYRDTGHFTKAMPTFQSAWDASKNLTDANGKVIGDLAVAQLSQFQAYLGRKEDLAPLLSEIIGRDVRGTAGELVQSSKRGLSEMHGRPEISFRCGPLALTRILMFQKTPPSEQSIKELSNSFSTPNGLSLTMVQKMSAKAGMNYQMAYRTKGAKMIVPAVAHWKMDHYAAIVAFENGQYLVQDSTLNIDIGMKPDTLDEESSGYFLVPAGQLPEGWRSVRTEEGAKVWGRGNTGNSMAEGSTSAATGTPANPSGDTGCKTGGCTTWNVEAMSVSLLLHDRPLTYRPPVGPAINIDIDYSHRDVQQPSTFNYVNLGPKWTMNWLSYVTDTIASNRKAVLYVRGGGSENFTTASTTATTSYASPYTQSVLTRTVNGTNQSTEFKRYLKDGSVETFGVALGNKFFLTEVADPQGNKVHLTYDSRYRIAAITDAIGQVTTFSYEHSDPLKITKVTDPFGRSASFTYNASGQLDSITDTIGITSRFAYGTGDFVSSLTTPYGTTTFTAGNSGSTRTLTAKDALGRTSRVEFNQSAWPTTDPVGAPTGMDAYNYYLNYRNTFIWNPVQYEAAMASGRLDYTKAKIIHWLHTPDSCCTDRTPESIKEPGENRVWYRYPGQRTGMGYIYAGTSDTPIYIGRLMEDKTIQLHQFQYNAYGKVTQYTDPKGRIIQYTYAANGIDVTGIANVTGGSIRRLAFISYNAQHLPTTVTGANGATTSYEYNSAGQITKITDPLGNATTYAYNSKAFLTSIQGPTANATYNFTYDPVGRLASATDPAGAKVSYEYDNADRPTKVTFPDGTSSSFAYTLLDLTQTTDRLGQVTQLTFDAERQLVKVADPLSQITEYAYTQAGHLASITDARGNMTKVTRDIQGRVTEKTYADGTVQKTAYEDATSRIKSTTDAMGQITTYNYNVDDTLAAITYSNAPQVLFGYDAAYVRPTAMQDGTGVTGYSYHDLGAAGANQLKLVQSPVAGTGLYNMIEYAYDGLDRVVTRTINGSPQTTAYDALGRITSVTNALDTFNYSYFDATGRVSTASSSKGPKLDMAYFDATGDLMLKQMKYTAGGTTLSQFDYEYNANNNVTKFSDAYLNQKFAAMGIAGFDPKASGSGGGWLQPLLALNDPTALGMSQATHILFSLMMIAILFMALGWLALISNRRLRAAFLIPPILAMTLLSGCGGRSGGGGNGTGNPSTPTASAAVTSYAYDKADRLLSASVGTDLKAATSPQYAYEYDAASNLTGITANAPKKTYTHTSTNSITGGTYDANGSPSNLDGASYKWDGANRLIEATVGLTTSTFAYDGLSRLVRITESKAGIVTSDKGYGWCGNTRCSEHDLTTSNAAITKQYFDQGEIQGTTAFYYVTDRLGSVRQLVDASGTVQAQFEYDSYGNRAKISGNTDSDFGFTGLFHHAASGLDLALYRAYDSTHGRWLNRDPIEEDGGLNLYGYVGGNPPNATDNSGLALDTLADVGFIGFDIYNLLRECGNTSENWTALGLDLAGLFVPFATGLGEGYRATKTVGQLGKEGESAVRAMFDIGEKTKFTINGRTRIPDGLTPNTLSEVKNVEKLNYTRQLRDYADYAEQSGRSFDLYTRPNTKISSPLQRQIENGRINRIDIPK